MTNEEQVIVWEGYGLRLHIPSHSLPKDVSQFELKMEVGLSGDFELPSEDGLLVSALYSFIHELANVKLHQPVILEIQHCATPNVLVLQHMSIICASTGSNKFEIIPGGDFTTTKGYGTIQLSHFSSFGIFFRRYFPSIFRPYQYCCEVYTTSITKFKFDFEVCIFRDLQVLSKVSLLLFS